MFPYWEGEPWPEPVNTDMLLREIEAEITRYVATLGKRSIVPALWIMQTYVHDIATHSPILLPTSAEPDCGKTTLLNIIGYLAYRGLPSVDISGPALFRSLTKWRPTFIIDEAETMNDDLRQVVNSGWTRGSGIIRCDPETHDPRLYSTFAPKAVGLKGMKLPDTTLSRTLALILRRKTPDEVVADFKNEDNEAFAVLRRKLRRWAADYAEALRTASLLSLKGSIIALGRIGGCCWLLLNSPALMQQSRHGKRQRRSRTARGRASPTAWNCCVTCANC